MSKGKVIKPLASREDWMNLFNRHNYSGNFIEGTDLYVLYHGRDDETLKIGNVSNAYKRGKECTFYTLKCEDFGVIDSIIELNDFNPQQIFEELEKVDFELNSFESYIPTEYKGATLYKSTKKGINTFSPLHLAHIKPLKNIPKKWNIGHAIKILANNQFENLRTSQRLTDDYAHDAAYNFGKGAYDRNELLSDLIESRRGWWVSGVENNGDELGINCHHFDYKKCIVRLEGAKATRKPKPNKSKVESLMTLLEIPSSNIKPAGILLA